MGRMGCIPTLPVNVTLRITLRIKNRNLFLLNSPVNVIFSYFFISLFTIENFCCEKVYPYLVRLYVCLISLWCKKSNNKNSFDPKIYKKTPKPRKTPLEGQFSVDGAFVFIFVLTIVFPRYFVRIDFKGVEFTMAFNTVGDRLSTQQTKEVLF